MYRVGIYLELLVFLVGDLLFLFFFHISIVCVNGV